MSRIVRTATGVAVVALAVMLFLAAVALSGFNHDTGNVLSGVGIVAFAVVGAVIVIKRPDNRVGPLLCVVGLVAAVLRAANEYALRALIVAPGSLPGGRVAAYVMMWCPLILIGLVVGLLPQVFPDGRVLSRRVRFGVWAAWGYVILGAVGNALDDEVVEGLGNYRNPYPVAALQPYVGPVVAAAAVCLGIAVLTGVVTIVLRWRRSAGDERQQLKWFVAGVLPLIVPVVLHDPFTTFSEVAFALLLPLVPAAFGVAILRYRLYDLDVVLNRALVYAVLTALIAGLYLSVVTLVETGVGADRGRWVQVVATVVAAAVFQPARSAIQRAVDRLFYGDRSRPYDAIARLGLILERAPVPETVLPGIVESVAAALRLPYVAIDLREGDEWIGAAAHGMPVGDTEEFAMVYQDGVAGRLIVGRRGGQKFGHADRRLLADLARQAGVAAHGVQLTLALQRSRAALVTAREEERRRLRRDLHDGLGPALAGVTLGLHAAEAHVRNDPDRAVAQLQNLAEQVEESVRDIRRLVYGLRPPALDELGLSRAIQREAGRLESDGLVIAVDVPSHGLGRLPAAVEAAAYRIVTEALTNVSRHAGATTCWIHLVREPAGYARDQALEVEVRDNGCGLDGRPAGVGLAAMRERADELGGSCLIESLMPGTRVVARLPILEAA
jgi:signal transduction histidine kinase